MQFYGRASNALAGPLRRVIGSEVMKIIDFFSRHVVDSPGESGNRTQVTGDRFEEARREMVGRQIRARGIHSLPVLDAMASVPRHLFVPPGHVAEAYTDSPLAIGAGQTISQPYMVAAMADALLLNGTEKVLEVGGGSGYQAAVLSLLAREVIAVESQSVLADAALERLTHLGYRNVRIETGDGSIGWIADAPYDAILVTAGAPAIPPPLIEQLAEGGRLVIPIGPAEQQELVRVVKRDGCVSKESLLACRFVPLVGRHGWSSGNDSTSRARNSETARG
jgi:protein-L-isoaspartate(D-aspartate) O-methyltransferase